MANTLHSYLLKMSHIPSVGSMDTVIFSEHCIEEVFERVYTNRTSVLDGIGVFAGVDGLDVFKGYISGKVGILRNNKEIDLVDIMLDGRIKTITV